MELRYLSNTMPVIMMTGPTSSEEDLVNALVNELVKDCDNKRQRQYFTKEWQKGTLAIALRSKMLPILIRFNRSTE